MIKSIILLLSALLISSLIQGEFINIAFRRKTYTSSGNGSDGVDGDFSTSWGTTNSDPLNEWFVVDLVKQYKIFYVLIYHLCPSCDKKSPSGYIVGMAEKFHPHEKPPIRSYYRLCGEGRVKGRWEESRGDVLVARVNCESELDPFRYVIVQRSIDEVAEHLAFSELEVFADVASRHVNVAYGKPAYIGSSTSLVFWRASNCVDEDTTTSCRSKHRDSWFLVDLINEFVIKKVRYHPELEYPDWDTTRCVVGLSRHFMPKEKPPRRFKYDICGYCPPTNLLKESVDVDCERPSVPYRYLILQQYHPRLKNFVFADLEVFALTKVTNEMIGCFKLEGMDKGFMLHYVEDCVIHCRETEMLFSALQDDHCHCLANLPTKPPSPLQSCNIPCPHEATTCGGTMHFHSVYRNYPEPLAEQMLLKRKMAEKERLSRTLIVLLVLLGVMMTVVLVIVLLLGPLGKFLKDKWMLSKLKMEEYYGDNAPKGPMN